MCAQVLDAIDARSSALIVAPTSSGKTFISAYCINSVVLREDDPEGRVVFVAPNRALVNQVAAQVGATACWALRRLLGPAAPPCQQLSWAWWLAAGLGCRRPATSAPPGLARRCTAISSRW